MAPTAYPGFLGVAIELKSKSFYFETPKSIAYDRNTNGLVSWKKITHFLPYFCHV